MSKVRRIFTEKKQNFNVEAKGLLKDLKENLNIKNLKNLRIINRYDVCGINNEEYERAKNIIFSEATVDYVYNEEIKLKEGEIAFVVEYLPGQYDQRADSASQCLQILIQREKPIVKHAKVIVLEGELTNKEVGKIKNYYINNVDSREASLEKSENLERQEDATQDVEVLDGFIEMSLDKIREFKEKYSLAMTLADILFCQQYFKNEEKRNPTITEIKVIDTYWSDHCRHTTFNTKIDKVEFESGKYTKPIKDAYDRYLKAREYVYEDKQKDMCLMDIAVMGMKELKKQGKLQDLEESDEINACSIECDVDINGEKEKYLVMFKNETHNHPTEIEPFGGAATCLGGAIRDPLSGRSYIYQAMRVTGSADPRKPMEETLQGKLSQRQITTKAANGYSSYGNQIGLATGAVEEIYHEDFVAKRMEIGAVIGAAPKKNVVRMKPVKGDVVILVGGRTGRDGCGGATGSSKEHDEDSILQCGAEVQKGNAPVERKIQRLFRNEKVSNMIKKCNDFGAGGVCVAIGELSDSLKINLDLVTKKYNGLDGTELAISESQERMAVVVSKENAEAFIQYSNEENLEATVVADVEDNNRLVMSWKNKNIVDISRSFLDTNGAIQKNNVIVEKPLEIDYFSKKKVESVEGNWIKTLQNLNVCSKRGLIEKFDSSIGAGTVLMPFGGKYQGTPSEVMCAKIPVENGETSTGTLMSYGYNPNLSKWSPFHGALYAVIESVSKIVIAGGDYKNIRLTFQEYFEKLNDNPEKWGKPFTALLGAFYAQSLLEIPAIGGKDSMSGTFKDINVPPTLVSFAVNVVDTSKVISQEFKKQGSKVVLLNVIRDENLLPDFQKLKENYELVNKLIKEDKVLSASSVKIGGIAEAISKMCFGNKIGIEFLDDIKEEELFVEDYGSIILELKDGVEINSEFCNVNYKILGCTTADEKIKFKNTLMEINKIYEKWEEPLETVFPTKYEKTEEEKIESSKIIDMIYNNKKVGPKIGIIKPKVFIPVFPGTNCEYDLQKAFNNAGANVETKVFRNLTPKDIEESINSMYESIKTSQIIMLPGGFSAGDEPDGSGKFIATAFRNPKIKDAVMELLNKRDGLMLGICNGFQVLIKLGLVPYGEIRDITEECPTLTFNKIGRHTSKIINTKVVSNLSPWLNKVNVEDVHSIAVSHGEGRFVCNEALAKELFKNGQVATQYVDLKGNPTYDIEFNPNGSMYAVEGITSPDGRVFGKMGHSERIGQNVYKNIIGEKDQRIFQSGVEYFK